jgi:hypothetical protein
MRSSPSARSLDRFGSAITYAGVAAMTSLHGAIAVSLVERAIARSPAPGMIALVAALTTPLLAVRVVDGASRHPRPVEVCLARALIAGCVNIAAVMFVLSSLQGPAGLAIAALWAPLIALFGSPLGILLAVPFGVALGPLAAARRQDRMRPDHALVARTAIRIGSWMVITALLAALLAAGIESAGPMLWGAALATVLGALLAAGGVIARWRLRRFVASVARGERQGWSIVARDEVVVPSDILPIDDDADGSRVLVREAITEGGAYRGVRTRVAWALLGRATGREAIDAYADVPRS